MARAKKSSKIVRESSLHEAGKELGIAYSTINRWVSVGAPHERRGRGGKIFVDCDEIKEWAIREGYGTKSQGLDTQARQLAAGGVPRPKGAYGLGRQTRGKGRALAQPVALAAGGGGSGDGGTADSGEADGSALDAVDVDDIPADHLPIALLRSRIRKNREDEERLRLANQRTREEIVLRREVHEHLSVLAGILRRAIETIQTQYGEGAAQIMRDAVDRFAEGLTNSAERA